MKDIEEKLWAYIDGTCTPGEQKAIAALIEQDKTCRLKYQELLLLNSEFAAMEIDEPPMAFTYNVMETIRAEHAQKPLKAAVNKRIITGIFTFFAITLLALLVLTLSNVSWADMGASVKVPTGFKMPDITKYISRPVIEAFLFFDVVLGLFLFDGWLRNKKTARQM